MADWTKPSLSDTYVNFLTYLDSRLNDVVKDGDPNASKGNVSIVSPPTYARRYNSSNRYWEVYSGGAWGAAETSYNISIDGNAGTATKLQTPRTINSVSFDGSANISVNTNNQITFKNDGTGDASGAAFNGSAAKTISYNTIGAPKIDGTGASGSWAIDITGNSATTSQTNFTALTISGSQVITAANYNSYVPSKTGTGASGSWGINVTGNAATATSLTGGGAGQLPYQSGANTTAFLAAGSSGQILMSNGTSGPYWANQSALTGTSTNWSNVNFKPTTLTGYGVSAGDSLFSSVSVNYASNAGSTNLANTAYSIMGGSIGSFLYQMGTDHTATLAPSGAGKVMVSQGAATPTLSYPVGVVARQCAIAGPINTTTGLPSFMPSSSSGSTVTSQGVAGTPLIVHASGGIDSNGISLDRIGHTSANITWTGLYTSNGASNYGFVDVNADGTMTTGVTPNRPYYNFTGTPYVGAYQNTFLTSTMTGYEGNGSGANQTWRVFLWEGVGNGTNVINITPYAYCGRYDSGYILIGANSSYSVNHNLGVYPLRTSLMVSQQNDNGVTGWVLYMGTQGNSSGLNQGTEIVTMTKTSAGIRTGPNYIACFVDSTGTQTYPTSGYARLLVERGW